MLLTLQNPVLLFPPIPGILKEFLSRYKQLIDPNWMRQGPSRNQAESHKIDQETNSLLRLLIPLCDFFWISSYQSQNFCFYLPYGIQRLRVYVISAELHFR